jgi:protein disulfide-isomerase A6
MKPAWGEFGKLHAKSAELLVGEVDCTDPTGGGEALCERFEVEGFPTLKFFEAGSAEPEEFDGDEMSVEGFEAFSKALLGPPCSPSALEACSAEDRKVVESYRALSPEARAAEKERLAAPLAAARAEVTDLG